MFLLRRKNTGVNGKIKFVEIFLGLGYRCSLLASIFRLTYVYILFFASFYTDTEDQLSVYDPNLISCDFLSSYFFFFLHFILLNNIRNKLCFPGLKMLLKKKKRKKKIFTEKVFIHT